LSHLRRYSLAASDEEAIYDAMGYPQQVEDSSDFEKLTKAFTLLTGHFSSFDDFLAAFGLANMPAAQRYGIMFGVLTFVLTVSSVVALLTFGGSFKRIAEQSAQGDVIVPDVVTSRSGRPLLLERLLEARERMITKNYEKPQTSTSDSKLTKMVLNVDIGSGKVSDLVDESAATRNAQERLIPPGYQAEYVEAYRKCQDKPFGAALPGRPECRFKAYGRAFAGCGTNVNRRYKRSYARLYECFSCATHGSEEKFRKIYDERPQDLIGRLVRLEALDIDRHLEKFYNITSGNAYLDNKAYNPKEVWGFLNHGPFRNEEELKECPIFQRGVNEAAFAIIENLTDRLLGVVVLSKDKPEHLTIQLEPPIIKPSSEGSAEPIEACFLLMEKLFALGYRRIQMAFDTQDAKSKKLAVRLGFTKEAEIPKHMIVKDASRDSAIYSMLNSDWEKSVRSFVFQKLHGLKLQLLDED